MHGAYEPLYEAQGENDNPTSEIIIFDTVYCVSAT